MDLDTDTDLITFFKILEPFFYCYFLVILSCLVSPRWTFQAKTEFLNKMLKAHHLQGNVTVTEKAIQKFRTDKWILLGLVAIALCLYQLI